MTDQDETALVTSRERLALAEEQREIGQSQLETLNRIADLNSRGLEGLNRANANGASTADLLTSLDVSTHPPALNGLERPNLSTSTRELLNRMGTQSAENPQPEATPPETRQIDLTARRQELFDAHATALHQVHYLEGAINEIDYLLELVNPQPANTAEGALT